MYSVDISTVGNVSYSNMFMSILPIIIFAIILLLIKRATEVKKEQERLTKQQAVLSTAIQATIGSIPNQVINNATDISAIEDIHGENHLEQSYNTCSVENTTAVDINAMYDTVIHSIEETEY